ncbi:MAG TPA: DUF721 domain-containing protein [Actinomycetota bacterium]|nr:DUF721 domain-containing protein [Actinomycetota bacterium]
MPLEDDRPTIKMRGGWPTRLGDALPVAMAKVGPSGLMAESRVRRAWPAAVGQQVAANAWVHRLRGTTLEVAVSADVWANELSYMSQVIKDRINAVCGAGTVTEVVVRRPRGRRR